MFSLMFIVIVILVISVIFLNEQVVYPARIKKINELVNIGNYEEALSLIQNLPEKQKINPEIQYQIYDLYTRQNQFFVALFHLNEILKRNVFTTEITEVHIRIKIAELYEKMEKPKQAIKEFNHVLELDPLNFEVNKKVGDHLYHMKNFAAALPYYEKALEVETSNQDILENCAEIYYNDKMYEKAAEMAEQSIRAGNNSASMHLLMGKLMLLDQDYQKTIDAMQDVLGDPKLTDLANLLIGISYYYLGDLEKAYESLSESLLKFNEDYSEEVLEGRYVYADILVKDGRLKDSLRQLQMIISSKKAYKDVTDRNNAFTKIQNSSFFRNLYALPLKTFLSEHVIKNLSKYGYQTQKTKIVDTYSAIISTKKNVSSGQSMQSIVGFDFNTKPSNEQIAKEMVAFIRELELTSGQFYSHMELSQEASDAFSMSGLDIQLITFEQLEKIFQGEKNI